MAGSKITTTTASGTVRRVAVVGGGLAGLMTVIKLCEAKVPVDLLSLVPVKRSHSVCAQGGINASVNTKGEGDSPKVHLEETVYGGDFLANQPPVKGMADAAPEAGPRAGVELGALESWRRKAPSTAKAAGSAASWSSAAVSPA